MEREFHYEVGNGQLMSQKLRDNVNVNNDKGNNIQLADVVYIFYSKDEPGIKFYDRTPKGSVAELTGSLPEGVFLTDIYSISEAIWDKEINVESHLEKEIEGSSKVKTIMVTREKFMEISQDILNVEDPMSIKIDTRTLIKYNDMSTDYRDYDNTANKDYDDILKNEKINEFNDNDKVYNNFKK